MASSTSYTVVLPLAFKVMPNRLSSATTMPPKYDLLSAAWTAFFVESRSARALASSGTFDIDFSLSGRRGLRWGIREADPAPATPRIRLGSIPGAVLDVPEILDVEHFDPDCCDPRFATPLVREQQCAADGVGNVIMLARRVVDRIPATA